MKILGITAEYNPLHNGHMYHLREAMERSGADCSIVVMSGNFTQRGEPAIADKWIRARQIVQAGEKGNVGADIVVELPFAFACNTANNFAAGGVDTLVKMDAECISFGCEAEEPDMLVELAQRMTDEEDDLKELISEIMKEGFSYAKANHMAVEKVMGKFFSNLIMKPNNILAVEYLKRIGLWEKAGKNVVAIPVIRKGSSYDGVEDLESNSSYAGATQIRQMISEGVDVSRFVPDEIHYEKISDIEVRQFIMLKAIIVRSRVEELAEIYGVGEGLHHKMKIEINDSYSMDEYLGRLVSKRYTEAAIRRILTYVMLGVRKDEMDKVLQSGITFARTLAVGSKGRNLIRKLKAEDFSIITNINKERPEGESVQMSLDMSIHSSDIYNMLCSRDMYEFSDRVFRPYIVPA